MIFHKPQPSAKDGCSLSGNPVLFLVDVRWLERDEKGDFR